jgi:hypothetical protein
MPRAKHNARVLRKKGKLGGFCDRDDWLSRPKTIYVLKQGFTIDASLFKCEGADVLIGNMWSRHPFAHYPDCEGFTRLKTGHFRRFRKCLGANELQIPEP